MRNRVLAVMASLAAMAASPAAADTWVIDSSHSGAHFSVRHMMVANVRGAFSDMKGTVEYDGKNISGLQVSATIDAATIDTRDAKRDEHLRSADFFDVANHPTIEFKSKKTAPNGDGTFTLVGDLTMRGVTKEVALDVEGPTPPVQDPWGNTKVGATATTTLNRKDFGINWNKTLDAGGFVVGDEIKVTLELELAKKK
jgi:polyisoprenoid-binding protein YceI